MKITWRPLTQWPGGRPRTMSREDAKFRAGGGAVSDGMGGQRWAVGQRTSLATTLKDLDRELSMIGARDVVVQIDITERQLRNDGGLRMDASASSPPVVLTFTRRGAPYVFACDHFKRWQDNLRAIALGLEGLRRLERFHIAQAGDQYRGWAALPASTTTALSTSAAADVLSRRTGRAAPAILADREVARQAYREAASRAHPDVGGSTTDFQLIHEAKRVLEVHFGGAL